MRLATTMADICELSDTVSSHDNEQVEEEHVEEEIIQDFVTPDQSWRGEDDVQTGDTAAENEPENLDDAFPDDAGVFCLDSEDEVKHKISTYEKNSGTHFIVLKKEKGYSQTVEEMPPSARLDNSPEVPHQQQPSTEPQEEFICKQCNVAYRNYKSLWQHNRDNHQDKLTCGYCDYSSGRAYNIKQHRKRRHPNLPDPFDPGVADLFSSAYSDESRAEYSYEMYEDDFDHREPSNKRPSFSQDRSPTTSRFQDRSYRDRDFIHEGTSGVAYPIGLMTSREASSHLHLTSQGRPAQIHSSQAGTHRTDNRSTHGTSHTTTAPIFPRIVNVTGNSTHSRLQDASTSSIPRRENSGVALPSDRNAAVSYPRRLNSSSIQDETDRTREERIQTRTLPRPGNVPRPQQEIVPPNTQRTSSSDATTKASGSLVSSSQKTTSTCSHSGPRPEMATKATCTPSREVPNTQNKVHSSSSCSGSKQNCSSVPQVMSRNTFGDRQRGSVSTASPVETSIKSSQTSPSYARNCDNIQTEETRAPLSSDLGKSSQGSEQSASHFTMVRGIVDQHRQGTGLTDIRSLLQNFRVRSITERVVHPDGTRYEIQIDGEGIVE